MRRPNRIARDKGDLLHPTCPGLWGTRDLMARGLVEEGAGSKMRLRGHLNLSKGDPASTCYKRTKGQLVPKSGDTYFLLNSTVSPSGQFTLPMFPSRR